MINPKKLIKMAREWQKVAAIRRKRISLPRTKLFEMSEEEFGLPSDGPITLPCDSFFMEYILFLVQRGVAKNLEKALLTSVAHTQSSSAIFSQQEQMNSRLLVCSY
ncbi:unnamed protein product, partial [Vitis vinifera]